MNKQLKGYIDFWFTIYNKGREGMNKIVLLINIAFLEK